jgi:hypothetical protein
VLFSVNANQVLLELVLLVKILMNAGLPISIIATQMQPVIIDLVLIHVLAMVVSLEMAVFAVQYNVLQALVLIQMKDVCQITVVSDVSAKVVIRRIPIMFAVI